MPAFTTRKPEESTGNTPVPAGTYEVILKRGYSGATRGGTETFDVQAVIRNDVDQPQKNRIIFLTFWPKCKNQEWLQKVLDAFCDAVGIPAGTEFDTWDAFGAVLEGRLLRLTVVQETDDQGYTRTQADAYWRAYEKTLSPDCKHQWKASAKQDEARAPKPAIDPNDYEELTDDGDLPF